MTYTERLDTSTSVTHKMTFLPRKLYEPGGLAYIYTDGKCRPLAPHLAGLEFEFRGGKPREVTWDELTERKRVRQRERLNRIRFVDPQPEIVPCYVWTFNNGAIIPYGGWWCYVVSRYFSIGVNRHGIKANLAESIMREIPLGYLPVKECFNDWMKAFAKAFPRSHPKDHRQAGSKLGWLYKGTFTLRKPDLL
jgi:hypothetical protein